MIFATVGTHGFDELVQHIDTLVAEQRIKQPVAIQIGQGEFEPTNCDWFRLKPDVLQDIRQASIVITHYGATVYEALGLGKRVIVISNPKLMNGTQHDHASRLEEENYILLAEKVTDIESLLEDDRVLGRYSSDGGQAIADAILNFAQ